MKLNVKTLDLDAGGKTIVILNSEDAQELGVQALERVILKKNKKELTTIVNITDQFIKKGQIAVYDEVRNLLNLKNKSSVNVIPRPPLESKRSIKKKLNNIELSYDEIKQIIDDVLARNLNDLELASLITSLQIRGLTLSENLHFANAIVNTSKKLKFSGTVVDKHSIGGIPGDKTSLILVPIIAAAGLTIPKTSSRAITDPAGTADRMESLSKVSFKTNKIKQIVKKTKACLIWGGSLDLAPADNLLIQIEKPLSLDPLIIPSVLGKKKVMGSKHIIIDIPCGPEAKVKTKQAAKKLARDFITIGKKFGMDIDCAITKANQPLGYAIGPTLEAKEALATLCFPEKAPKDLIDKVTTLGGMLLKMLNKGNKETAKQILLTKKAEKKFRQILKAQGGNPKIIPNQIPEAKFKTSIKAKSSGIVSNISNHSIIHIAKHAGAPKDKLAGILLNKKLYSPVKKNDILFTIYSSKQNKLDQAVALAKREQPFTISTNKKDMLVATIR